jgi:ubiquitin-conjugating enzyme E2 H
VPELSCSLTSRCCLLEYVSKYASRDAADDAGEESADDDDMSSVASFGDDDGDDEEPAGKMDEV